MKSQSIRILFALALMVNAWGCGSAPPPAETPAVEAVKPIDRPLTEAECREAVQRLATAFSLGKGGEADKVADWSLLVDKAVGQGLSGKLAADLRKSLPGIVSKNYAESVSKDVAAGGSYRVLQVREKAGSWTGVVRHLKGDGAPNYHEFALKRGEDGQVRISDLYVHNMDDSIAETYRRAMLSAFVSDNPHAMQLLATRDRDFVYYLGTVKKQIADIGKIPAKEVQAQFDKLPVALQRDKLVLALRVRAAWPNDESYLMALNAYEKHFGQEPGSKLILLDRLILTKDYPRALASIDAIEEAVGGDPYLNVTRAKVHMRAGDFPAAIERIEDALAKEKDLFEAHQLRVGVLVAAKEYADACECLDAMKDVLPSRLKDLNWIPGLAELEQSSEFQEWTSRRAKK